MNEAVEITTAEGRPRFAWSTLYRSVGLVACIQFFVALEGSLLLPLGPTLSTLLNFPARDLGYLTSAFLLAAALSGLLGSFFFDRFDRKWALGIAMAGLAIGTAVAAGANDLAALAACRFAAGLFGGPVIALGLSVVGDIVPADHRGRAMGAVSAASGLAIILGVPFALELSDLLGWRAMLLSIGGLGLMLTLGVFLLLPRNLGVRSQPNAHKVLTDFADMLRLPETAVVLTISALIISSTLVLAGNLASYFVYDLGTPESSLKYIWSVGGLLGLVGSQAAAYLADRYGPARVLVGLSILAIATFILLFLGTPSTKWVPALFCSFMVCASGRIVMVNTISSLASRAGNRGRFMSLVAATNQLVSAIAVVIASMVLQATPNGRLANMGYLGAYGIMAATISALATVLLGRRLAPKKNVSP